MKTFDQWWEDQPIARLPDSSRVAYLRDLSHRVWISAQQAIQEPEFESTADEVGYTMYMRRPPSLLTYAELVSRAENVFFENTRTELETYSFQQLLKAVEVEEDDRKHGTRPNYRIDDVAVDGEWRR